MKQLFRQKDGQLFIFSTILFCLDFALVASKNAVVIGWDKAIRHWVNTNRTGWLTAFFTHFTRLFDPAPQVIMAVIIVGLYFWWRHWRGIIFPTASIIVGSLLNKIIKHLVNRPRPRIHILLHYSGYSFPSGHSSGVMLILGSLIILLWEEKRHSSWAKWLIVFLTLTIFLVGCSRVYVGAHYPSDVLGGWLLGLMTLSLLHFIMKPAQ